MTALIIPQKSAFLLRKLPVFLLAFCWIGSILLGIYLGSDASVFNALMYRAFCSPVSIVGLVSVLLLPFLFSAFAVYIARPSLLLAVCVWKGFSFSFLSVGLLRIFSSGGWLLRQLLMFSSLCQLSVLYWFWIHHISGERKFSLGKAVAVVALFVLIGCADYCCISPFLASIINL